MHAALQHAVLCCMPGLRWRRPSRVT